MRSTTGGWVRTYSALGVHDFMKCTSLGHVIAKGPHAAVFASFKGFEAHALTLSELRPLTPRD